MLFSVVNSDADEPDTLANICLECVCRSLADVFERDDSGYYLNSYTVLTREICESLIESYQRSGHSVDDEFVKLFEDKTKATLQNVTVWNSSISDAGLRKLLQYNLWELDLAYCKDLTTASFDLINEYGASMKSLSLGPDVNIVKPAAEIEECDAKHKMSAYVRRGYVFKAPKLMRLVLKNIRKTLDPCFYETMLLSLPNLTHLDLSCCNDLGTFQYIENCPNLTSLILFNCANLHKVIPHICQLTKLRHLDLSKTDETDGRFEMGDQVLRRIVTCLPNLVSLDISGTNLAGKGNYDKDMFDETQEYHSDIPGLTSRATNPLQFLGLYGTAHQACKRHDIPAIKISGDANEDQLLTASTVYMNRPQMLQRVLNDLFHFLRLDAGVNTLRFLQIILEGLNTHAQEKYIQISGSAALFYIVRHKQTNLLTQKVRKLVINTLLNSMKLHINDDTMLRNGCLTLCQFRIPQDILFVYNRLVELLLHIIMDAEQDGFVQRIAVYLMNSLACQVNDAQKEVLGNLGIIEKMLTLIRSRIEQDVCDDVLEVAWSTMWNVTDETPINCQRFLDSGGMTWFMDCLKRFHENNELMRNMMGLLGNVAEVKELRGGLMPYMNIFYDLLNSFQDGIEVSYNAAGVIAHIASDGPDAWKCDDVTRKQVLQRMARVINKWDLFSERNINYRSFEPILKLTRVRHTRQCQHWAIWALANLTKMYPEKYCPILEAEGGLKDVQAVIDDDEQPLGHIRELARMVISNYRQYKEAEQSNQSPAVDRMNITEQID